MDQLLTVSQKFWEAMEHADEAGMRACADANCNFVHIGIICKLDKEIEFYTSGAFQPTDITFHSQKAEVFGDIQCFWGCASVCPPFHCSKPTASRPLCAGPALWGPAWGLHFGPALPPAAATRWP